MPVTQAVRLLNLAVQRMRCVYLKGCAMKLEKRRDIEEVMGDGPNGPITKYKQSAEVAYKMEKAPGVPWELRTVLGRLGDALLDVAAVLQSLKEAGDYEINN